MIDVVFTQLRSTLSGAEKEVKRRRALWEHDPFAAGMAHTLSEITAVLDLVEADLATVGTAEYAAEHHVTPQTVCAWIRAGELAAEGNPATGYRIRRSARRIRHLKRA